LHDCAPGVALDRVELSGQGLVTDATTGFHLLAGFAIEPKQLPKAWIPYRKGLGLVSPRRHEDDEPFVQELSCQRSRLGRRAGCRRPRGKNSIDFFAQLPNPRFGLAHPLLLLTLLSFHPVRVLACLLGNSRGLKLLF